MVSLRAWRISAALLLLLFVVDSTTNSPFFPGAAHAESFIDGLQLSEGSAAPSVETQVTAPSARIAETEIADVPLIGTLDAGPNPAETIAATAIVPPLPLTDPLELATTDGLTLRGVLDVTTPVLTGVGVTIGLPGALQVSAPAPACDNDSPLVRRIKRILGFAEGLMARIEAIPTTDKNYAGMVQDLSDLARALESALFQNEEARNCLGVFRDAKIITRLLAIYFRFQKIANSDARGFIQAAETLTKLDPGKASAEVLASNFAANSCTVIQSALTQRWIFFKLATLGIGRDGKPGSSYFNWAWYGKINEDLHKPLVFPEFNVPLPPFGLSIADMIGKIDGRQLMSVYGNGGYEIANIVRALAADKDFLDSLKKSCLPQAMWQYATHPSPVNGHVSLSAALGEALGVAVTNRPDLVADFINVIDPDMGMTPMQFILQNLGVAPISPTFIPFSMLTDGKRWSTYLIFLQALKDALVK